jgi:aspartyl/asparaginyl-tRNA synthetase
MGWVNRRRDLGNLIFVDVRDRTGITQVVFNKERDPAAHEKASQLRNEYVIAVIGKVKQRTADTFNKNIPTGEVELIAEELRILNESKQPPFLPATPFCPTRKCGSSTAISICGAMLCNRTLSCGTKLQSRFAVIFPDRDSSKLKRRS